MSVQSTWVRTSDRPAPVGARSFAPLLAVTLVAVLAAVNYLVNLGEPEGTVWDESYYLTSTQRYEDGTAQFASHPPLGLMLIAAGERLLGDNRDIDTRALGRDKSIEGGRLPKHFSFVGERVASGFFAVAGAVMFFALMLALTQSAIAAALLANLYVFENAFIVHFRAAQLDAFQMFFAICALLCFVKIVTGRARAEVGWLFALGLSCGLATMVKLNGVVLALLGVMSLFWRLRVQWKERPRANDRVRQRPVGPWAAGATVLRDTTAMVAGGILAGAAVFTAHVAVGKHPPALASPAGKQDNRFISATYREYLQGERAISPWVVLAAARDYSRFVTADFAGMARSDVNASGPLQWPFNRKTINYRWDTLGTNTSYVQLTGNLFDWWLALAAPVAALGLLVLQVFRPRRTSAPFRRALLAMVLFEYLAFMAVHLWLGTHRVMYLYHYFIGLLLAFTLIPLTWMEAAERWPTLRSRVEHVFAGGTILLLASFVFYAPLTFHRPLTRSECEWRNVVQHVVNCRP